MLLRSRQAFSRGVGSGEHCEGSVCVPASDPAPDSAGSLLVSHSEEQLTISTVIWDLSSLPTKQGEEVGKSGETMGKSGEESLVKICNCSWSVPDSMLTLLHNPHRLCRVSARLCSSSVCSCSSCSFSLFCRDNKTKAYLHHLIITHAWFSQGQQYSSLLCWSSGRSPLEVNKKKSHSNISIKSFLS